MEAKIKFYINVTGGLGYNLALARVITHYGDDYDFYIKSPYWDVFRACEKVKHVYKENEGRDFIMDAKRDGGIIIQHRLYDISNFIYKKLNYTQAWCWLLGLPQADPVDTEGTTLDKLDLQPCRYFPVTPAHIEAVINDITQKGYENFILVQFWGGQSPIGCNFDQPYTFENEPLKRAYPIEKAQDFVNLFKKKNPKTAIIQYSLPNEPTLAGCEKYLYPYMTYYELSKNPLCKGAVTIDSSLAHLITGNCKVLTIWAHSHPANFGYAANKNILQECDRSEILYFTELGPSGTRIEYIAPEDLVEEAIGYLGL